jgi:FtsH-binding integral membrane protein
MGIGTGIFLIAVGAVLSLAVEVDLPYVDDDALGLVLVIAGIVSVVVSVILKSEHPEAGVGTGILLFALGACLAWAVNVDLPYIEDYAMGAIMMVAGGIAIIATVVTAMQRRDDHRPAMPDRY